jgi:molybdate transport system ATP-binding protein
VSAGLVASIGTTVGSLDLQLELTTDGHEVVALLGPNGAGKTTALRCLAGLHPLERGRIELDGQPLDDPGRGRFVPPHQRPIGVVFQDHLLFPHLDATTNVAFGLRARGVPRRDADRQAHAWLERMGLADHATARPGALSGGQAQRVALARALAIEPRLLLLDEPLAALDATVRSEVRADLRRHLAEFPGIRLLVTHDPVDALVLADRLVILEHGRVTQTGTTADVVAHPRSRYVADLVGINLLPGRVRAGARRSVELPSGAVLTVADPAPTGTVAVAIRPQAVALHRGRPRSSARNAWAATVAELQSDRARVRVRLDGPVPLTAEVTRAAATELALEPGGAIWASVKAVDLSVYEH